MKKLFWSSLLGLLLLAFLPAGTVFIPHIAFSGGWQTFLVVDNAGYTGTTLQLALYDQGVPLGTQAVTVAPGETRAIALQQGSCGAVTYEGINLALKAAYIHQTDNGIAEFRLGSAPTSEINFTLPQYLSADLDWMGVAVMNPGDEADTVNLEAFDSAGNVLGQASQAIPAKARLAAFVRDLFPSADYRNVARVKATATRSICGITISGKGYARLLFTRALESNAAAGTVFIPHITDLVDVWTNRLILDNRGTTPATLSLNLYHGGATVVQQQLSVGGLSTQVVDLDAYAGSQVDCGTLTGCPDAVSARLSYTYKPTGAAAEFALNGDTTPELVFNFPGYAANRLDWNGFCLFNTTGQRAVIVLKAFKGAQEVSRELITIPPNTRYVNMLGGLFPTATAGIDRVVASGTGAFTGLNMSGQGQERYLFTAAGPYQETRMFEERLSALPGVTVIPLDTTAPFSKCYRLDVTQPLDHSTPNGATFVQSIFLMHLGEQSPMVLYTTGYGQSSKPRRTELSSILNSNEIIMPHRFFVGAMPADLQWQYLTIVQSAADSHRITALLHDLYRGIWANTGASKGGMTAMYHRRFYPDDVEATVAYVAPLILGLYDERFAYFVENVAGTPECRQKIRQFQRRLLERRNSLIPLLAQVAEYYGESYSTVGYAVGFECMVMEYAVAFWQYGPYGCSDIPPEDASDNDLLGHLLDTVNFLYSNSDVEYYKAFYYQALTEFGYYGYNTDAYADLLVSVKNFTWTTFAPQGVTMVYNPEVMQDIKQWVQTQGNNMIFIYGGNDPWTSNAVELTGQTNAIKLVQPFTNHGTRIVNLDQKELVYTTLENWLGVPVNRLSTQMLFCDDDWIGPDHRRRSIWRKD